MGQQVLIQGTLSSDGRTVTIAPGMEVMANGKILATLPTQPSILVLTLGFDSDLERAQFQQNFDDWMGPALG